MKHSKEVILGIVGILTIAVLYYGISFLKGMNLFTNQNIYYVCFEDAGGLTKSSPVYADGYSIGIVNDITYDYQRPKHVVVEISVDHNMRIPAGSYAELEKEMLGTIKMHLMLANNPRQRVEAGDTIPGQTEAGLMAAASNMIPQVEQMLPKLDSILTQVNNLLADPALQNILHNTDRMTANLENSTAKLNRMMNTEIPALTQNLNAMSQNINTMVKDLDSKMNQVDVEALMARVNCTLNNVESLTSKLNSKDNTVGLLLNDPTLYNNLSETTANAASLMGDLKAHPKRYVHFSIFGKKDKAQ